MTSRALWREDEAIDGVRKTLRHQLHPEQLHKEPKNWKALASPSPWKAHWFLSISSKPSQFPLEGDWNALREVDRNSAGMQPWVLFQLTAYIVYSEPKVRRRLAVWVGFARYYIWSLDLFDQRHCGVILQTEWQSFFSIPKCSTNMKTIFITM